MPPRKPKHLQKSKAESTAENYFPVDETNLKRAVEKVIPVEEKTENVEVLSLKPEKKKRKSSVKKAVAKTKKGKKFEKTTDFSPPKISLKKNGYEMIITEKPQAAMKISSALGKSVKRDFHGIPYYEVSRNGKKIIVACAVGHLFTLKQISSNAKDTFPVFDIKWVPNFLAKKKDFTEKYHNAILKLAKEAGSLTVATDYDIEGEVIGLNVVRFICGQKDAGRMKFSTLTDKELNMAYEEKSPRLNWGQAIAGETRHYLDWFYGINLSRALMNAIKNSGRFKIMSIGRVQGPALKLIVDKEKEIQAFKPQKYWQVFATIKNRHKLELKHNKDIFKKSELEKFDSLIGKKTLASTEKKSQTLSPQPPFDLTTLQTEAYRVYGLSPSRTLQIAQSLYLNGLISYPRTSSQKLPDSIGYREILSKISEKYNVKKLLTRTKPVEGKKTDPAHPSIYPTGNFQILSGEDEKVYDLISRRFLALFCDDAIIDRKTVKIEIDGLKFSLNGSAVRKKAWLEIYLIKMTEKEIPDINGEVEIIGLRNEEKETQAPRRYTQASIISELERRNLGTKATRSSILETLYDRGYVKEKSIEATPLGISLIEALERYSPIITDENLTREFEKEMSRISEAKSGFEEKEKIVMDKAKETIKKIASQFEKNEKEIGKELVSANDNLTQMKREENILSLCPACKKGNLIINYSKKNRRFFIACNAYPDCKNTYSVPPNSLIKNSGKQCEKCGFQMVMSIRKGKRPWILCFNPECEKNRERIEEYRKKKEMENLQKNSNNNQIKSKSP
ncbi:DNA topoisomerase I [Candidatus Pacearchaeota archaeon]|nr:DNA topoisomerase I [Candidatus Pacearchaeota archaeon]